MDAVGDVAEPNEDGAGDWSGDAAEADLVADVTLLPFGSTFRYLSGAAPSGWQGTAFADATWASGAGQLGFGDGDEKTVIPRGPSGTVAYYFRARFNAAAPNAYTALKLRVVRDDGLVAYLNGVEVARNNMPTGAITSTTRASVGAYDSAEETRVVELAIPTNRLVEGSNVLAIEVHQVSSGSSDVSFNAEVRATPVDTATPPPDEPWSCPTFATGVVAGNLQNLSVTENSGMAPSTRNAGVYWMHNDSGDSARVFATTLEGRDLGAYAVSGASASDWEDMAVGPGPAAGTSYLYIGDIGGNGGRNSLSIYRVAEPSVSTTQSAGTRTLSGAERLNVVYPNGERYDAESMFVDPETSDVYIVTKSSSGSSRVFRDAAPHVAGATKTLVQVGTYTFPSADGANPQTTGGDISPDGREIIVRTYNRVYMWHRSSGASVGSAFGKTACSYKIITEPQGESACFSQDGRDLILSTEHGWDSSAKEPIYRYARK